MIACPVPNCGKLVGTRRGLSSHFVHCHTKEEKEQYVGKSSNTWNSHEEPPAALATSNVRHEPPQSFWRMAMHRLVKARNSYEKTSKGPGKQNKIQR